MAGFHSRSSWGALPPKYVPRTDIAKSPSVTAHWEGTGGDPVDHTKCAAIVKNIQIAHLNDKNNDYSDIAYNLLVCQHGDIYEGRGRDIRPGANGTAAANFASYAVCFLRGVKTTAALSLAEKRGFKAAVAYLQGGKIKASNVLKGHRDWVATDCPGDVIYHWVVEQKAYIPTPPSQPPRVRLYVVRKGDSYWSISKKVYGTYLKYLYLRRLNKGAKLFPGMKIRY